MNGILHITSGDSPGARLAESGITGEVFVWRDILYEGIRNPGWPDDETLNARARFLAEGTDGALNQKGVLNMLRNQYRTLSEAVDSDRVVLWFDACLFDQSMLTHILTCLRHKEVQRVELLCVDAFPGIVPFDGLGQLLPAQLVSVYGQRRPVTSEQFSFAETVDRAFALQDRDAFVALSKLARAPLPWVPAAVARWLEEEPDPETGLGRLEQLALDAVRAGYDTPGIIFTKVSEADTHPQFWGDTTLWEKINALAERDPPLVRIEGPALRLPQWKSTMKMEDFRITALPI